MAARRARVVHALPHLSAHLGRHDGGITPAAQRRPQKVLGLAAAVDVGGVEEGDPGVEGRVHDARHPGGVHPAAKLVAPHPDDRHLKPRLADATELHLLHSLDLGQRPARITHSDRAGVSTGAGGCTP